ncbi:MAG TPA: MATE family efflux transporter, partial [Bacteroidota bacterium]|nr:MATE family efflux transporter [Bacteroidota bacterium]
MNERLFLLENEKIIKLIYKFSLPSIIGLLITASYTIIDRIFIGNGVGVLALSGVTIIFPIIMIGMAFSMLVGIGSTALVSIRLGEKKINEAEQILGNAISVSIIISIFLIIFCYLFIDEILYIFGADKEVFSYAKEFLIFFLPGTIFQLLLFTLNNIIRGEGNPKTAMYTMFLSSIVNIILNPLFIFVFKLGVKGSAIATVISQFISCTWVLLYFYSNKSILKIRIHNLKLKFKVTRDIFSIGMASFAMHIVGSIVIMIFNSKLKIYGGDLAIASLGIINSIVTLFLMPIFGINQGIQPILGYNYGAKRFNRI